MSAPAAAAKAEGNSAFASKNWSGAVDAYSRALELEKDKTARGALYSKRSAALVHLERFDEALADANAAVLARPEWSKAYARVGECYARQQDWEKALDGYCQAINRAEDAPSKTRYTASWQQTLNALLRAKSIGSNQPGNVFSTSPSISVHFSEKVKRAEREEGYKVNPRGGLAVSLMASKFCKEGFEMLDKSFRELRSDGNFVGNVMSTAIPDICEAILLDEVSFLLPAGKDPNWPLHDKFAKCVNIELRAGGMEKYFTNAIWAPKDIIDDLNKRLATEGQDKIRMITSSLIHGQVVTAFVENGRGNQSAAVQACKLALGLLVEGRKKWAEVPSEDRGMCFEITFIRIVRAYLLKCLLRACSHAKTASAKKSFKLEDVEKLAKEMLEENKVEEWPEFDGTPARMAYYVMPRFEAVSALAFVHSQRARAPFNNFKIPSGKVAVADRKEAKEAARLYDEAVGLLSDDTREKREMVWHALEQNLRAGGLKIKEVFQRAEEAQRIQDGLDKFYDPLPSDKFEARTFSLLQVSSVRDTLSQLPPGHPGSVESTLKPVPTLNMQGTPPGFNPQSAFDKNVWDRMPGDVMVVDVLGLRQ